MDPIKLNRPEVADKYEAAVAGDLLVHLPGYNGRLSNVNLAGAAAAVRAGYLKVRATVPPAAGPEVQTGNAGSDAGPDAPDNGGEGTIDEDEIHEN